MNKILLIIKREYFSRVKKKSFLLMTFLVPGLIIGMYALVFYLAMNGSDQQTAVTVSDDSGIFAGQFKNRRTIEYSTASRSFAEEKKRLKDGEKGFLLHISKGRDAKVTVELFSKKKAGLTLTSNIESQMNSIMRTKMLRDKGVDEAVLKEINPSFSVVSKELTAEGDKDSSGMAALVVGFAAAVLIYISLMIYGSQVMRGVIEEKTNRIIEIVISSVKPFQLMMGKIIGIGLVGLTQFLLWIVLSSALLAFAGRSMIPVSEPIVKVEQSQQSASEKKSQVAMQTARANPALSMFNAMNTINFKYLITNFIIYFLGGFMLYSALFAAVGSAVDGETETQQFVLPITMPLLFTYILSFAFIVNNPDSTLSFWMSIIPFTSPIAMMVRLPFGVPDWQLALSIVLLIGGFIATTWIASRIYRVGILMYGKKVTYRELAKWFMYKE